MVIFALALTVLEILIFQTVDLENLGKGHVIEKLNSRQSTANINLHRSHKNIHFCASSYSLRYINISFFDLENLG